MEQKLAESQWNSLTGAVDPSSSMVVVKEREVIHRLEGQVDEQRKMRLNDAKQVEAKAAKIKEWVTNKLREVRSYPFKEIKEIYCLVMAVPHDPSFRPINKSMQDIVFGKRSNHVPEMASLRSIIAFRGRSWSKSFTAVTQVLY